jgi:hypothetical protein
MVTHSSTSRPVQCLCMAERTGCPVFTDLWSYVLVLEVQVVMSLTVVKIDALGRSCLPLNRYVHPRHVRREILSECKIKGKSKDRKKDEEIMF